MSKALSQHNEANNRVQNVIIENIDDTKRIMKIHTNDSNFKRGEIIAVPREFKSLSTEEKQKALQAMEDDGIPRTEMSYYTGLSAGRISQLIGKKRRPSDKELYVTFEPKVSHTENIV